MKKCLSILLSVILMVGVLPLGTFTASAATSGYYTYTVSNGEAAITDCDTSISGEVIIPSTLGGYPVTSIGDSAFWDHTRLTSIIIPDSVTSIGNSAFSECRSLTSITIPNSVTRIGNMAFSNCKSLTSITIPDGVTNIGDCVFFNCKSLTSITIPDNVTYIGYRAFCSCESLTSITIPNNVTYIEEYAFKECISLTSINVDAGNSFYSSQDGILFDIDKTLLICYPAGKTAASYTILNSVESIYYNAFEYCKSLISVTIPDAVTTIDSEVFRGCSSLTSVTIPNSVTHISYSAFEYCESLTTLRYCGTEDDWNKISISSGNLYLINATRYYHDFGDWQIKTESTCTKNGEKYRVCSICGEQETEIILPGHNYINGVCTGCNIISEDMLSYTLFGPDVNVFELKSAFDTTNATVGSTVGTDNIKFGNYRPAYPITTTATYGENISKLSENKAYVLDSPTAEGMAIVASAYLLADIKNLNVNINAGVDKMIMYMESPKYNTKAVNYSYSIPFRFHKITAKQDGVSGDLVANVSNIKVSYLSKDSDTWKEFTTDDSGAMYLPQDFKGYVKFDLSELKNNWSSSNKSQFDPNKNFRITAINLQISHIGGDWGPLKIGDIFEVVKDSNSTLAKVDGAAAVDMTTVENPKTNGATITDCDTSISGDLIIPSILGGYPVTTIGDHAFCNCSSLTSITIPNSVTSIGDHAFSGCTSLANINVDAGNSFYSSQDGILFNKNKTKIISYPTGKTETSYTIPDSVTSIGNSAFYNCKSLTSITIPDSVTSIGNSAFYNCKSLTSITITDSVTSIGEWAFSGCTSLASITIPNSVTSIGRYAFYYCTSLTSITIPDSVTSIGYDAFYYCDSLEIVYYCGTLEEWETISISEGNDSLTEANRYYHNFENNTCIYCGEINLTNHNYASDGKCELCDSYIESKHNYVEETDETWVISKEKTANITITFSSDTFVEEDWDFIYIYDANDNLIGEYTGGELASKSITVLGNTAKIRLVTDRVQNYYGFKVTNIEFACDHKYNTETKTLTCTEDGYKKHTCEYCGDIYYTDEVKATGHNYSTVIKEPICIEGGCTTHTCEVCGDTYIDNFTDATGLHTYENGNCTGCNGYLESDHDYPNLFDETWTIYRKGAVSVTLTFSAETFVEQKYDFIYIYDANDNEVGKYTGDELSLKSVTVMGDTAKIRLSSDRIGTAYGFKLTDIIAEYEAGDFNGDGVVDVRDLVRLKKILAGLEKNNAASPDVDGDGETKATDLIVFIKFLLLGVWTSGDNQIINPETGLMKNADYYFVSADGDGHYTLCVYQFDNSFLGVRNEPWGVYSTNEEWKESDDTISYKGKTYYPIGYGGPLPRYYFKDNEIILDYKYDPELLDDPFYANAEYRLIVNYEYDLEVIYSTGGMFEKGDILDLVE